VCRVHRGKRHHSDTNGTHADYAARIAIRSSKRAFGFLGRGRDVSAAGSVPASRAAKGSSLSVSRSLSRASSASRKPKPLDVGEVRVDVLAQRVRAGTSPRGRRQAPTPRRKRRSMIAHRHHGSTGPQPVRQPRRPSGRSDALLERTRAHRTESSAPQEATPRGSGTASAPFLMSTPACSLRMPTTDAK
jgi:hypothetical protein